MYYKRECILAKRSLDLSASPQVKMLGGGTKRNDCSISSAHCPADLRQAVRKLFSFCTQDFARFEYDPIVKPELKGGERVIANSWLWRTSYARARERSPESVELSSSLAVSCGAVNANSNVNLESIA